MSDDTLLRIASYLEGLGIPFRQIHHEPTTTSEASARARGESLEIGGKAILLKIDDIFRLFVLSAALRLDSAAIRRQFQAKKIRFASREELLELTGLVPGSVPPFGPPILPFELFVDPSILANEKISFNAGSLEDSIVMALQDYLRAAAPQILAFSEALDKPAEPTAI
jgi:prolyl-tRNA editing enzyme YbaK/EbsC (Cys-tRNA(Pro) deacylase)